MNKWMVLLMLVILAQVFITLWNMATESGKIFFTNVVWYEFITKYQPDYFGGNVIVKNRHDGFVYLDAVCEKESEVEI